MLDEMSRNIHVLAKMPMQTNLGCTSISLNSFEGIVSCVLSDSVFSFGVLVFVLVVLLFCVHGKHLRSCRDGQLT